MSASEIAARIDLEALLPTLVEMLMYVSKAHTVRSALLHCGIGDTEVREALCRRLQIPDGMTVGEFRERAIQEFLLTLVRHAV